MRHFILLCVAALSAVTPARSAPNVPLPEAVQKDVQCFMLFAAATNDAATAKDEKKQAATSLAIMYFIGKLAVAAPGLDLVGAVRQQAVAMQGNPHTREIGVSCDEEFGKRGSELRDVGQQLQNPAP